MSLKITNGKPSYSCDKCIKQAEQITAITTERNKYKNYWENILGTVEPYQIECHQFREQVKDLRAENQRLKEQAVRDNAEIDRYAAELIRLNVKGGDK